MFDEIVDVKVYAILKNKAQEDDCIFSRFNQYTFLNGLKDGNYIIEICSNFEGYITIDKVLDLFEDYYSFDHFYDFNSQIQLLIRERKFKPFIVSFANYYFQSFEITNYSYGNIELILKDNNNCKFYEYSFVDRLIKNMGKLNVNDFDLYIYNKDNVNENITLSLRFE